MSGSFPGIYGNFKFHALFLHPKHMKFPEITGNFIWFMYFPVQGHDIYLTFPSCTKNFMCLVNFQSLAHLTFPENVRNFTYPILKYVYVIFTGISYTYLKFHMSCKFPKPRTCDIYLTFPESVRNFTCPILKYM